MRDKTFIDMKLDLSGADIEQIVAIVCKGCQVQTYSRIRSNITYSPSHIPNYGILERLTKDDKCEWSYCAGQSYPDEIRTIRDIFKTFK
jgi:hypothetical protein